MKNSADILVVADENPAQGHHLPLWFIDQPLGLTAKSFGYLVYLITRKPGCRLSISTLEEHFLDRRTAVASGLAELEKAGYLYREQLRRNGGVFAGWRWHVAFTPRFLSDENPEAENLIPVTKPATGKPDSGVDYPEAENLIPVRLSGSGKPDSGGTVTRAQPSRFKAISAESQSDVTEITNAVRSGNYKFALEIAPQAPPVGDIINNNSAVNNTELEKTQGGSGGGAKRQDDRVFTNDQQFIWDEGWVKGRLLLNGAQPLAPSRATRIDFKTLCSTLLEATLASANANPGTRHASIAAHQLFSIFQRADRLDEWKQINCLSQPKMLNKYFEAVRDVLIKAKKSQGPNDPRPQLTPEQFEQRQAQRKQQHDLMRGFTIPEGQAHFTGDKPPRRPEDDYPDDDDFTT